MKDVRATATSEMCLLKLRDIRAAVRIQKRIDRLEDGYLGDHKRFSGLLELRLDYGPGYRIYCLERGKTIVIILAGGNKSGQRRDIEQAITMAKELKEE